MESSDQLLKARGHFIKELGKFFVESLVPILGCDDFEGLEQFYNFGQQLVIIIKPCDISMPRSVVLNCDKLLGFAGCWFTCLR